MKISVIQVNISQDKQHNLRKIVDLTEAAVRIERSDMVILPEMSAFMAADPSALRDSAEPVDGPFASALSDLAARLGIFLHAGSIIEARGERRYNTSFLFGRDGALLGRYSKVHRFDVTLPDGTKIRESAMWDRGEEIAVVHIGAVKVGFAICYDLRFGELFRKLVDAGATLIVLPSAFTFQTGADHWEVLVRARAIETQCYVAAPGQWGSHDGGKGQTWGHSMIVDPWGVVVAQASSKDGYASATIDLDYLESVRTRLPVQSHRVLT